MHLIAEDIIKLRIFLVFYSMTIDSFNFNLYYLCYIFITAEFSQIVYYYFTFYGKQIEFAFFYSIFIDPFF